MRYIIHDGREIYYEDVVDPDDEYYDCSDCETPTRRAELDDAGECAHCAEYNHTCDGCKVGECCDSCCPEMSCTKCDPKKSVWAWL